MRSSTSVSQAEGEERGEQRVEEEAAGGVHGLTLWLRPLLLVRGRQKVPFWWVALAPAQRRSEPGWGYHLTASHHYIRPASAVERAALSHLRK
jgi:hypothetical protein